MCMCCFVQLLALCLIDAQHSVPVVGMRGRPVYADMIQRLQSKTDDESGVPAESGKIHFETSSNLAVARAIEPIRSMLVVQLESYGGKAYARLADTILALVALLVVHFVLWYCMYARCEFDLADDGQLSVMQKPEPGVLVM